MVGRVANGGVVRACGHLVRTAWSDDGQVKNVVVILGHYPQVLWCEKTKFKVIFLTILGWFPEMNDSLLQANDAYPILSGGLVK